MAASTYFAQVQQLYIAYFGRPADTIGQAYWAAQIDAANGSIASVIAGFSASAESAALFGNKSTIDKVTAIYQNAFGRAPEPTGLAFWVAELDSGRVSQAQASWTIQQNAGPGDAAAVQNKLTAAQAFTAQLDTTAEITGYQGAAAADSARAFLKAVTADNATATAAVSGAAAAVVAATATGLTGATFTLTTGVDNFVGDAGNNVFVGGNGATNTFGPADQLDGGAGTDTLKLYGGNVATGIPTIKNIENVYLNATTGNLNVSTIAGVTALELDNVGTGNTFTLGATQALKLSNQAGAVTVAGSVAGGVTLNGAGTAAAALTLNAPATSTSLNLTTTTQASNIVLTGAALTSVKVVGDQALTLNATGTAPLTSVDVSKATAGVNYTNTAALDLTFTGGAGADRVNLGATVTAADKLDGGAGVDTLAITTGGLTTAAVAGVKGFEVLETVGATTQDASVFAPANVLTGLSVGYVTGALAGVTTAVTDLAATAKDNIKVADNSVANTVTLSVKDFVSGGTSDSATVAYTGVVGANAASTLNFANVDVLNLTSNSTNTAATTNIVLNATDLEKLVVTGNIKTTIDGGTSTGITEVDASGLKVAAGVAGLTFTQATGSTQNLLVTGSNAADTVTVTSAKGTVVANGGNDTITFSTAAVTVGDLAVKLGALDFVAGGNVTVSGIGPAVTTGVIDFTAAIENTLKVGGLNLGTSLANVVIGATLDATTNVAFDTVSKELKFDLNGDGVFTAGTDFAITLTGAASVTYNAAADVFIAA